MGIRWFAGSAALAGAVLAAILAIASVGEVVVTVSAPPVRLSAGQRTSLGNFIAAKWPGVSMASVRGFDCKASSDGDSMQCRTCYKQAVTASALFGLLQAGIVPPRGEAAAENETCTAYTTLSAGERTSFNSFVSSLYPSPPKAIPFSAVLLMSCPVTVAGSSRDVDCRIAYADSVSQAAAFTLWQSSDWSIIESRGVVQ